MFRERFAFYSPVYPTPDGNLSNCFWVADDDGQPVIDGVIIPIEAYVVRKEVEWDLSMCSNAQLQGILGKY